MNKRELPRIELKTRGRFLWAKEWSHKSHDGWMIALLDDRNRETRLSFLKRNAPADLEFPPKHTPVEVGLRFARNQPRAVLKERAYRASQILYLHVTETSGMDAATPDPPDPGAPEVASGATFLVSMAALCHSQPLT